MAGIGWIGCDDYPLSTTDEDEEGEETTMATIIDFTAIRNERAAQAKTAQIEQAKQAAIAECFAEARQAAVNQDAHAVLENLGKAAELQTEATQPMPAYCDPSNRYEGSKYQATKEMGTRAVPGLIRADIKNAVARGLLPKGLKVSVRQETGSMYYAINVKITAIPDGWKVYNREYLRFTGNLQHPPKYPENWGCAGESAPLHHIKGGVYSPELQACLDTLKEIYNSYQRDNSDSMSDYFDVRYYGDVSIDYDLGRDETA